MNMSSYSCCQPSSKESVNIKRISPLLKLIAEESRLKLLCILNQKNHCVCELMEHVDMSQSLISHHLRDLKDAKLVIDNKNGLRVYYSITPLGKAFISSLLQIQKKK
jgi:ArsR family transcriptional regulator